MNLQFGRYVLMVHFRNPYIIVAGSERFIIAQERQLRREKIDTVVIFPVVKNVRIFQLSAWGIVCDGKFYNVTSARNVMAFIDGINGKSICMGVFVHSFINVKMKELLEILSFRDSINIYLHDFSSCCVQYNLLKNDKFFCGDTRLYAGKCQDCVYFEDAKKNRENVEHFFNAKKTINVIAPSELAKELWHRAYPAVRNLYVLEHILLQGEFEGNGEKLSQDDTVRVAFIGNGTKSKGWDLWIDAVDRIHSLALNYEFYHFGQVIEEREYVEHIEVSIKDDGRDAMIQALRDYKIHVAILFSVCPETYSYTYYESIAANAYVITNPLSGNIQRQVKKNRNGLVIDGSADALVDYLTDINNVKEEINYFRTARHIAPKELKDNYGYMNFLKAETVGERLTRAKRFHIMTAITGILYKIRYRSYI